MKNIVGYFNVCRAQETRFYKSLSWDLESYVRQQLIRGVNTVIDNNFIYVKTDLWFLTSREADNEEKP